MSDEKILKELEELKREVASLRENRGLKYFLGKTFSKTSVLIGIALTFTVSSLIVYAATVAKPHTFASGTVISSAAVNANFDTLYSEMNAKEYRINVLEAGFSNYNNYESLEIKYIIAFEGVYPSRDYSPDTQFIGEIRLFVGSFTPGGWLPCDGRSLPISSYQALYSIIGTTYGGNGSTFALPDLRGKVVTHPD